jgi:RHS repeat-associated protein
MRGGAMGSLMRPALVALLALLALPRPAQAQETVEYYGLDALGSVRVIFNAQGGVIDRMDYGPFGENLRAAIKFPVEQFAQLARDAESGQDYAEARNYSAANGRHNRVDPAYAGLFNPQAWNRYAYALNSPLTYVDTDGLNAQGPGQASCSNPAYRTEFSSMCAFQDIWMQMNFGWGGGSGGGGFEQNNPGRGGGGPGPRPPGTPPPPPGPTPGPGPTPPPPTESNGADNPVYCQPETGWLSVLPDFLSFSGTIALPIEILSNVVDRHVT